jgi:hypothetical protein
MTELRTLVAATLMSAMSATSAFAGEPQDFEAIYPDRDSLNGGALTPAGRLALEPGGGTASLYAANKAAAGIDGASPSFSTRRHPVHAPVARASRDRDGRRHRPARGF